MSLFVCSKCSTICTQCVTGKWHGEFVRRPYDAARDGAVGPTGLLLER